MKITFSCCLLIGVCLSCCNSNNNTAKKEVTLTDTATTDSAINHAINKESINSYVADSALHIYPGKKDTSITISGNLNGNNHNIKIYLHITSGDTLHAFIEPLEQHANIRLNQIIYPGGKADGPFGRDQKFALKNMGIYQLIIGNNLMAEGKIKTAFNLHLSIY
ncbi:MAG: hypothetical protein M3004_02230 [Bacteroidota bacterium]|nr:hypothetical protein [Bacteroidota bacterium]